LVAAVVLVVGILIARVVGKLVTRALSKTGLGTFLCVLLGRFVGGVLSVFALIFALQAVGVSVGPLIGAIGIIGLALAFAFQDILENVIAGLLMLARRPIAVGDEVVTNGYMGTVTDMTLRAAEVTTLAGETVYVPNAMVWKSPVTNLTVTPTRRSSVEVGVSYDTDLDRAKRVLEAAAAGVDGVLADPAPAALTVAFGGSSIDFDVRYWHDSKSAVEWRLRDEVHRAIKRALDDAGIEIPFPQQVVHHRPGTVIDLSQVPTAAE
jgi:small-conductance mechanosensitive channel